MRDCLAKISSVVFILGLVTICPTLGFGSVLISLNNEGSTTLHEIEVVPGGTFSMDVNLEMDQAIYGVFFRVLVSDGAVFEVLDVASHEPWGISDASIVGPIDPMSGRLQSLASVWSVGPGSSTLATLSVGVQSGAAQGTYALDVVDGSFVWDRLVPAQATAEGGPSFSIHVIPEPAYFDVCSPLILTLTLWRKRGPRV